MTHTNPQTVAALQQAAIEKALTTASTIRFCEDNIQRKFLELILNEAISSFSASLHPGVSMPSIKDQIGPVAINTIAALTAMMSKKR